ncbi:Pfs, NACHT and WD domain protein [Dactylonectria macrodidyma]|uniref:Pfs, NACHT and WD domain protein n=1 Tax=Dactylonectria macrodidyma TaxID=307937 RepID=A0A9P9FH65_9HYPO|nr:Pfs, NACHT and WD domain protein [Dactylonectria macrodidyma]
MSTRNAVNFTGGGNAGFQLGINHGNITNNNCDTADSDCLKALRLTDPRDDKRRIRDTKGGLLLDSSRWILEHPDFRQWRTDDQSRLLWIKGDPGKGKTMLMIGITEELERERELEQCNQPEQPTSPVTLLAYFFCQGTDSNLNNSTAVLRGLIFHLAIQHQSLTKHLRKEYNHSGSKLFEGPNAFFALSRILGNMLRDPSVGRAYVFIDALDECDTELEQLLNLIVEYASAFSTKWIVSSRNIPEIEELLEPANEKVRLSLELNHKSIAAAVRVYIDHEVAELTRLKSYDPDTEHNITESLRTKADDTFLWVALVCQNLRKVPQWRALETLEKFPSGLHPLYRRMMEQIKKEHPKDLDLFYQILAAIALVYRPVTLIELGTLIKFPSGMFKTAEGLEDIIKRCGSFLTVRSGRVYIIHLSAKDYLEDRETATLYPHGRSEIHRGIFMQSLHTMSNVLHRDMYRLRMPSCSVNDTKTPEPDPLATVRYSCIYWVDHLNDASRQTKLFDVEPTNTFLKNHSLHWIEALSLLRSLGTGIVAAAKILSLAEVNIGDEGGPSQQRSKLAELAYDIWRFLRQFKTGLEAYPLQVHALAIIFSPTHSLIKQISHDGEASWLSTRPLMQTYWSACLQTLEGHEADIVSMVSSADGKQVASVDLHGEIRVWDLATGECVKILEYIQFHKATLPMTFSPDGRWLASGYGDGTVGIWDLATSACFKMLGSHGDNVESVAFCHDAKQLVSVSGDAMLKIWDTTTRECIQTQRGGGSPIKQIVISPNGKWLMSLSESLDTIRVWDVATGRDGRVLSCPGNFSVSSMAFSPVNKQAAVGFRNGIVGVWDVIPGRFRQILELTHYSVTSVDFSLNGKKVAAVDCDAVRLSDATADGCLQRFKIDVDGVNSVIFSPDMDQMVTGCEDGEIRVWDMTMGRRLHTLGRSTEEVPIPGHDNVVVSIAISPDGSRVASGSEHGTVLTWATDRGLHCFGGHLRIDQDTSGCGWVCELKFSPDSKQFLSIHEIGLVRLWDATTGRCLHTLDRQGEGTIYSIVVAFSPDSKQVMSVSRNGILRAWDTATGRCLHMHNCGDYYSPHSATFSPDGKLVALNFGLRVQIWDTAPCSHRQTLKGAGCNGLDYRSKVCSMNFSLDNKRIVTAHPDFNVRIWDITNGMCLRTLHSNLDNEHSSVSSPDGVFCVPAPISSIRLTSSFAETGLLQ